MKILLTNNHLVRYGGSETFTIAMYEELKSRGHDVDVFAIDKGNIVPLVDKPKEEYDLILINHNTCLNALRDIKGFKIFTSHGVFPALEQPQKGSDKYVAISEEISEHLNELGFENTIIRNGVDSKRFSYTPTKELKKIVSMCQGEFAKRMIRNCCLDLGLEFIEAPSDYFSRISNVEDIIKQADLVVTLGRGAYESMMCGKNVLIFDSRPYMPCCSDGLITPENINEIIKNNCSGRRYKYPADINFLKAEIQKYKAEYGELNHNFAMENFNISKQVDKYLKLWEESKI